MHAGAAAVTAQGCTPSRPCARQAPPSCTVPTAACSAPLQIIPAENLVAAYQGNPGATLLAAARDCATSRVMLEALEAGTDGVLLQTDSPAEVWPQWGRLLAGQRRCAALRALLQL